MNKFQTSESHRWFVLAIIMLGTFMAILDTTIVNVALPHMMSAFGVDRDKIEWVVTAFMLATAVTMTLMGWLANRLGFNALYLGSLFVFTAGSAVCATAWSYHSLIAARVLQAIGGGAIQPIGMAIITDLFEPHERGTALGVWGTGIMVGPAIGPTLGGYLTDWFGWRTIFSVNVPVGIFTIIFGLLIMKKRSVTKQEKEPLDIRGFIFLSMTLIAGLLALSNGQEKGWTSNYVLTCSVVTVVGLIYFIIFETAANYPILDLTLFKIRNFSLSIVLSVFRATGLFGGMFLLPIFLEDLVGYTTVQAGLWMMPTAIVVAIMMPIAGRLSDKYSYRWLVTMGTAVTSVSLILYGNLDPLSGFLDIIGPQILRGIGLAFMMTPLLTAALNAVPQEKVAMASGFLNIAQRVGGSFGIAMLNTYVTNSYHIHAVRLGELLPPQSGEFHHLSLKSAFITVWQVQGLLPSDQLKTMAIYLRLIFLRAEVLAFDNGFVFAGLILVAGIPFSLMLKPYLHVRSASQ